ncbi:hypothetical protein V0M98_17790 [Pseudomonas silesiensis]|jgi:hypothetical protein|uniref:hypothetical protein n=1 Tax=Pseudomonas TaxID=286 RepID=UPI0012406252|nr:hypothetical protein [Pseudomonas fluorescens]VVN43896.1 hypothetical protein PS639_05568 [Pseudomonas fluorescens]
MTKRPTVRTTTGATVTLTIEISNIGSWGPDCKIDQVYRQAREEAIGRINRAFKDDQRGVRILGPVVVKAITTDVELRG